MPPPTRELESRAGISRPSICLCMIVRDGAEFIERCLVSVREHIAYWVICDTGSVDQTRELVRRALESVPGELHEQAWVDFGHNRTELMRLARGKADYLLVIDQDDTFEVDPGGLDQLDGDAFVIRHVGQTNFDYRPCLMRGDREWRYAGRVHTQLATDGASVGMLDGARIRVGSIGSVRSGRYARELAIQLEEHSDNPSDARLVANIAHTYRGLGDLDSAIEWYDRRVVMGGNNEEEIFFAMLQSAVLRGERGDWPEAMVGLIAAWEFRPSRMEALYELASRLRLRGEYHSAYRFARRGLDQPVPRDLICVSPWMYEWGLLFEYSISAYWVGDVKGALAACRRLLAMPNLPDDYRRSTRKNMEYCVRKMAELPLSARPGRPPAKRRRR